MPTYEILFLVWHIIVTCHMFGVISSVYRFLLAMSASLFMVLYHFSLEIFV